MPVSAFENLKLGNQLCFALYAATNAITRAYRSRLSEVGLTYPQYLVMMVLWQTDGVPVKTLAQQLQLDSATVTPLLKRLEAAGFVRRQRSSEDERVVRIHLSDQGRHLQPRVAEMQKAVACQPVSPKANLSNFAAACTSWPIPCSSIGRRHKRPRK